jgi:MoaA/NifB/PqqE/SkfB family radical SAM enzyme
VIERKPLKTGLRAAGQPVRNPEKSRKKNKMPHPVHPAKILACEREVKEIIAGGIPAPRTVEIFVTTACNHSCAGCHTAGLRGEKPIHIPVGRTAELLEEWRGMGVRGLEISGVGEPLLHPRLGEILSAAAGLGFSSGLLTNGVFLDAIDNKLLLRTTRFIRVSYDSCDAAAYKKIHGADDLARVEKNVRALLAERRRTGSETTIGMKTLLSNLNKGQVGRIAARAAALGVDYIQFKALRNRKGASFQHDKCWEAQAEINKLTAKNSGEKRPAAVFGSTIKELLDQPCFLSPLHPVVDPELNLFVCPFYTHHPRSHRIGSLKKSSFSKLWGSPAHRRSIASIDVSACNLFDCPLIPLNNFARAAIAEDAMHLDFI